MTQIEKLERENKRLRRALEELSTLNELSRAIGASTDSHRIMQTIIRRSLDAVTAEQGEINLVAKEQVDTMKTLVRTMSSSSQQQPFRASQILMGWMQINKQPIIINKPQEDPRFMSVKWDDSIKSVLSAPLIAKSSLVGLLTVYNKKGAEGFSEEDKRLLSIIATQSAQIVENARLYEEEKALQKMQEEMRAAYQIQMNLLPEEPPAISGYDIAGRSTPAQNIGGDYFDFIELNDKRWAYTLGDITGKGMPAAMLMANLQAIIRTNALAHPEPAQCIANANDLLCKSTGDDKFATIFHSVLHPQTGVLHYCNAGHNNPVIIRKNGEKEMLQTGGIMIGWIPGLDFEQGAAELREGDVLAVYSDGVTEAENPQEEEFGDQRLLDLLYEHRDLSATNLTDKVFEQVNVFAGQAVQFDDITVMIIKRT